MLVPLLKHWRAHEKFGNEPMDLKAWIDGAPTMKLKSRVAFLLHFIDPRLHPGIHTFPQSRDWHHLVAEYFGSEDAASLRLNFEALIERSCGSSESTGSRTSSTTARRSRCSLT